MARILGIVCIVTLVFIAGCGKEQAVVDSKEAMLLAAIDAKFESPQAHFDLAKYYGDTGQWSKAAYEYAITVGFDPTNMPARAGHIKGLMMSNQQKQANELIGTYVASAGTEKAVIELAKSLRKESLPEFAFMVCERGLSLYPTSAPLHKELGYYYLAKDDKVMAEEYLRKSFEYDPYQSDVAGTLGRMGVKVQAPATVSKGKPVSEIEPKAIEPIQIEAAEEPKK